MLKQDLFRIVIQGMLAGLVLTAGIFTAHSFTEPENGPGAAREPAGITDKGNWHPFGRGWVASSSGDASVALTKAACEAASDWEWFEDANGDGDTDDAEDGICLLVSLREFTSWNGTETDDNTYIMDYDCTGSFPTGTTTVTAASVCALCVADCYDGRKDLPDQGSYTAPDITCSSQESCYEGPINEQVLLEWQGTRLPTFNDYFGYCGHKDGGDNYETGCSATTTIGGNGQMVGRTDECIDTSEEYTREWLSEQYQEGKAYFIGYFGCSYSANIEISSDRYGRAVFRP